MVSLPSPKGKQRETWTERNNSAANKTDANTESPDKEPHVAQNYLETFCKGLVIGGKPTIYFVFK